MSVATRSRMPATQSLPLAAPSSHTAAPPTPLPVPAPQHQRPPLKVVDPLPQSLPPWLLVLMAARKLSTPVVTLVILIVLPIYGWTVYTQQSWGKTYQKLEDMRREEHTLRVQNAAHKYKVTQTAEQKPTGLTQKGPHNTLFVTPAPVQENPSKDDRKRPATPEWMLPIGY